MSGPEREKELLRTFTMPSKRNRYFELLESRKGREKVRLSLDHFVDLDPEHCQKVPAPDQTPARIDALLRAHRAPAKCYVMSSNADLDGRELDLHEALGEIVGSGFGSFICCIPGRLAYFEGEEPGERYVCKV